MNEDTYTVYVKTDTTSDITAVNSSAFLADITGWTQIDEGAGDRFHHAQGNYFDKPIMTMSGIYRYKLIEGVPAEKSAGEIAAEESALPPAPPTQNEIFAETMDAILTEVLPFLTGT